MTPRTDPTEPRSEPHVLFRVKDWVRRVDEFLTRGSQFNGYSAPDPIAAHLALERMRDELGAEVCTCGHPFVQHLNRDVDDVMGWPCMECQSRRCRGFAIEAGAAQGAAPRAEGLPPWWSWDTDDDDSWLAEFSGEDIRALVRERNRLLAEAASDERQPEPHDYECERPAGMSHSDCTCWCHYEASDDDATG